MKKIDKFYKLITEGITKLGAVELDPKTNIYGWSINTKQGKLYINFHKEDIAMNVYTRFENPKLSKHLFNANPHSGKWNFHMGNIKGKDVTIYAEKVINTIEDISV